MATIRKPKLKKYGKKPSKSASIEAKQNYLVRVSSIDAENAARLREYDKKIKEREANKKKAKSLDVKIAGIGRAKAKVKAKRKR